MLGNLQGVGQCKNKVFCVTGFDRSHGRFYDATMWKALKNLLGRESSPDKETAHDSKVASTDIPVPPENREEDLSPCYEALGVVHTANLNQVRRAWKQKLKEVHMGHYADDPQTKEQARLRTRELNDAYHAIQKKLF
ncbi:MAG: hypothetical protein G3M70_08205 [Candidatus Nitronauta litoralis]|uniref:J domain-containing protein n=1 Tax=Candidatus Nitronauta litoralis TaxID=2705533 RepID=A0A7T0BW03_9BACT|nr:MAG: hypothetical protein G3M70_08205 [Candidatus Nitronauta litoralis]